MARLLLLLLVLTSCARIELATLKSKEVKRLGSTEQNRPGYYILEYVPSKNSRKIASLDEENSFSNKQIYFFTLLQQYKTINSLINSPKEDFSCPKFHNDILNFNNLIYIQQNAYSLEHDYKQVLSNEKLLATFPIMALPYNDGADIYSYYKNSQDDFSRIIKQAIGSFNQRNLMELKELCEVGSSDGYYIYENLVTMNAVGVGHDQIKLDSVLNISVFSNMLLIDSLKTSQFDSQNMFHEKVINRSNLGWFKNYLYELRKIRKNESKLSNLRSSYHEQLSPNPTTYIPL